MSKITIYPSNWLYNAGVVGLLSCLDRDDFLDNFEENEKFTINNDGTISINTKAFKKIKVDENYFNNGKVVNLKGKNQYYPNFIDAQGNQQEVFKQFIKAFSNQKNECQCSICNNGIEIDNIKACLKNNSKNKNFIKQIDNFFTKIEELNMVHNKLLGPSEKFPNAYWNIKTGLKICHLCTFLLIHHHLSFTKLSDGSEIFINAPSFNLMYELNKLVKEIFGKGETDSTKKREILAMSIIEYTRRLQTTLGQWNAMNIEILIKHNEVIEFYSLPYETVQLISDRTIASLISDIGEFSILNAVLNKDFNLLNELAYHLLRISIKNTINKANKKLINSYLYREINRKNLNYIAQKILNLYANIIDRRKKCQSKSLITF